MSSINKSLNDSNKNICERFRGFKCDKLGLENANSFSSRVFIILDWVLYLLLHSNELQWLLALCDCAQYTQFVLTQYIVVVYGEEYELKCKVFARQTILSRCGYNVIYTLICNNDAIDTLIISINDRLFRMHLPNSWTGVNLMNNSKYRQGVT